MTRVDPKTRTLLDLIAALGEPPLAEISVQQFRDRRARSRDMLNHPSPQLAVVRDTEVPGGAGPLKARLYDTVDGERRPALVYFHGGGFVFGDLDSHDPLCRRLAHHGGFRVIAVDYRLAPESSYPGPVEDAIAATEGIARNSARYGVDAARLAVGGDSAGGNLATVVARHAARNGGPTLAHQLLIYPVTQQGRTTPSRAKFSEGYFLTQESIDWFGGHYLPAGVDVGDERVSPLDTPPPPGLAPALVVTAGFDPLLDEGIEYAARLGAAGIDVQHINYPDQIHGFVSFTAFSSIAEEAIAEMALAVRARIGA